MDTYTNLPIYIKIFTVYDEDCSYSSIFCPIERYIRNKFKVIRTSDMLLFLKLVNEIAKQTEFFSKFSSTALNATILFVNTHSMAVFIGCD